MAGVTLKDDQEICTVDKIIGKRLNKNRVPEYLVSWKEYPNEETWEQYGNLINVKHLVLEYEESQNKGTEVQSTRKRDLKRYSKKVSYFYKGCKLIQIDGLKRCRYTAQVLCRCWWQIDEQTIEHSFEPMSLVKEKDPDTLLQYFEDAGGIYQK